MYTSFDVSNIKRYIDTIFLLKLYLMLAKYIIIYVMPFFIIIKYGK